MLPRAEPNIGAPTTASLSAAPLSWKARTCRHWHALLAVPRATPGFSCLAFSLISIALLVLPIAHTVALRNIALSTLLVSTVLARLRTGVELRLPAQWAWFAWSVVALASAAYAVDPAYTLNEIRSEVGHNLLIAFLAATWVRNPQVLARITAVLIAGDGLMVGYALFDTLVVHHTWQPSPVFGSLHADPGAFSTYVITVLPLLIAAWILQRGRPIVSSLLLTLLTGNVLALYFSGNRMGLVALCVQLAVLTAFFLPRCRAVVKRGIVFSIPFIVLGLGGLVAVQMFFRKLVPAVDPAHVLQALLGDARLPAWLVAWDDLRAHPWVGGGFGREVFDKLHPGQHGGLPLLSHAHNTFLNIGVQMGIPGIVAFASLLAATARKFWPSRSMDSPHFIYSAAGVAMVLGMVVKNLTDDFFVNDNALLFWLLCGAVAGAVGRWRADAGR